MRKFFKGVWLHHLPDKNQGDEPIKKMVKRLSEAGFDLIIPCVKNPDGLLDYPSKIGNIRPTFKGWDPLRILIREAHSKQIKVHPWLCVFTEGKDSVLLKRNNKLVAIDKKGDPTGWVCTAQEEVQKYEFSLYKEIMENYNIDGVHLDYIRTGPGCFCNYCRETFEEKENVDPFILKPRDKKWADWIDWRVTNITNFVRKVKKEASTRNIEVSAAVFTDYPLCIVTNGQDWGEWAEENLVDYIFPMNYTSSTRLAIKEARCHLATVKKTCLIWEGLYIHSLNAKMLTEQIKGVLNEGAGGIIIFSYPGLENEHIEAIKNI